ncbi:MAG: 2-C-methyl-D-erythritol 2,4-cyclodiphosphate synthase [Endozoicomonas sp. (ex Botrylloides leachii)]|nr:2-C-methyl-D-erythritol 2,4-cyclodiphosphate synthase [Endozoicomonas sp. (ex Botrylloides leachii)]
MRIGHGFDVHRFGKGDHILLGGVQIAHHNGLIAHSDGDVLLHSVCDALLGAAGLGDIGKHFPDTNERYKDINSRLLLRHVIVLLKRNGLNVENIDATIIAQAPKMAPHIEMMCQNMSEDIAIERSRVNVKATTTEQLGYIGRKEGIAVHTVALLSVL